MPWIRNGSTFPFVDTRTTPNKAKDNSEEWNCCNLISRAMDILEKSTKPRADAKLLDFHNKGYICGPVVLFGDKEEEHRMSPTPSVIPYPSDVLLLCQQR